MLRPCVCLAFAGAGLLFADGGTVLQHVESAPYVITVFASPVPARAGVIDLSVLVQAKETLEPALDADVRIDLIRDGSHVEARATRAQAQNKLLYAASMRMDEPGDWDYRVSIRSERGNLLPVTISGVIAVEAGQPKLAAYRGYLALPFLCLGIFALHQRLRHLAASRSGSL